MLSMINNSWMADNNNAHKSSELPGTLLVTDFDHTLYTYPDDVSGCFPDMRKISGEVAQKINQMVFPMIDASRQEGKLAVFVSSGNMREPVEKRLAGLLKPDAMYLKMGTEKWRFHEKRESFELDTDFQARMKADFNTEQLHNTVVLFSEKGGFTFTKHKDSANGPGKYSGHIAFKTQAARDVFFQYDQQRDQHFKNSAQAQLKPSPSMNDLLDALQQQSNVRLIYSKIADAPEIEYFEKNGYCADCVFNLDILHAEAGKDKVIDDLSVANEHFVIAAGDAGNDTNALLHDRINQGVIPKNGKVDLVSACRSLIDQGQITYSQLPAGLAVLSTLVQAGAIQKKDVLKNPLFRQLPSGVQLSFFSSISPSDSAKFISLKQSVSLEKPNKPLSSSQRQTVKVG